MLQRRPVAPRHLMLEHPTSELRPNRNRRGSLQSLYRPVEEAVPSLRPMVVWHRETYRVASLAETDLRPTAYHRDQVLAISGQLRAAQETSLPRHRADSQDLRRGILVDRVRRWTKHHRQRTVELQGSIDLELFPLQGVKHKAVRTVTEDSSSSCVQGVVEVFLIRVLTFKFASLFPSGD